MENMRKVRKTMMKVLGYLIIFLFMMMTAVGSYQIITRYFFNRPSTVSEELLTYSFTWMSLLASAYVFGKRDHMRMGFMADKLTGNFRKYLEIAIDLLSFSFAAVVMVYGGCSITKLTMIGMIKHTTMGSPFTARIAAMIPPRLAIEPTDRSNSLILITSVAPSEIITSNEICLVMLIKFVSVKNEVGLIILNRIIINASASMVPYDCKIYFTVGFFVFNSDIMLSSSLFVAVR